MFAAEVDVYIQWRRQ